MYTEGILYNSVIKKLEEVADIMDLDQDIRKMISKPNNEITVNFPVKMGDGRVEVFTGYRVQHNNILGPYKGGVRFHSLVTLDEIRTIAFSMTLKTSLTNIPFGGANGGIRIEPSRYTLDELEHVTRRFTFALGTNIGAEYDISEPDVNTNSQIMAWIMDTYLYTIPPVERNAHTHVVTGKPIKLGGSLGRDKASGQGLVYLIQKWSEDNGFSLEDATYMIQGFGNVGSWTARLMKSYGSRLIAVEDSTGPILNMDGIEPEELCRYVSENGTIYGYPKAKSIDHETFFRTKADIFVPAALGSQITADTAPLLEVKLIAEGTDNPTTMEGGKILQKKGIDVLPDILCNSGGVIVSYFEWLQNKRSEFWEIEEVDSKLHMNIINAYERVSEAAKSYEKDWRTAAYIVAISHLEMIYKRRGIFP
ncbi:Glu/Leu/Phe/Val dehydrogenase [candidate division WOR-3 bacterium]|nr:Glu/Leu/Phe/Val dehydrogenase [candidate division WOR-3 bacterium]